MKHYLSILTPALLAATMTTPVFAQVSTTPAAPAETAPVTPSPSAPATPTAPSPAPASDATTCADQFTALDANSDGVLTETEAPAVFARARVDGTVIAETGYTRDDFITACDGGAFAHPENDKGAPLEGANSFTENQAKDRAISRGYSDVGALTKDDMGVWRGSAKLDGADVSVAIDYKGNVVSTAP